MVPGFSVKPFLKRVVITQDKGLGIKSSNSNFSLVFGTLPLIYGDFDFSQNSFKFGSNFKFKNNYQICRQLFYNSLLIYLHLPSFLIFKKS